MAKTAPRRRREPVLDAAAELAGRPQGPRSERQLLKKGQRRGQSAGGTPEASVSSLEEARRKGPLGYLQLLGPGLVTGASDDDPSGIGTYSQVGSQFGFGLLWTALFTFPLMAAVQELCARIALQTGVGLGTALKRKFPAWIVGIGIAALFAANTFNVGADLGAIAAGVNLLAGGALPALGLVIGAAALVTVLQFFTTYAMIFRIFKFLTLALFAYVVAALLAHPSMLTTLRATFVPHLELSSGFITALVAVLGTTISPYLFFWQASSEVDEMKAAGKRSRSQRTGISRKEMKAARVDIMIGMGFSQLVMYCIILTNAAVLNAHGITSVQTAPDAAAALQPLAGRFAFILFAVGLIGTGLLAIPILTGSAAYAIKEFTGLRGTLAVRPRWAPTFYLIILLATVLGVVMNLIHVDPIKALFITAVINGVVAPPLLFFINLVGSDRRIMRTNVSGTRSRILCWCAFGLMSLAVVGLVLTTWGPLAG